MCRGLKRKEGGFTFLNALLDLAVLMLVLPLAVLFYHSVSGYSENLSVKQLEWELFRFELLTYLDKVDSIEIINNGAGIRINQEGTTYDIEQYLPVIRKQKFGQGHEIMLTGVRTVSFSLDGQFLAVGLEFEDGTQKTEVIAIVFAEN